MANWPNGKEGSLNMSVFGSNTPNLPAVGHLGGVVAAQQLEIVAKQHNRFLNRAHPPARLSATDAAEILGFHEDDMPILVREKLLSPLGNPVHNSTKYFALVHVAALGNNPDCLSMATAAVYRRNQVKAKAKKKA
jgi:hypothetical protein